MKHAYLVIAHEQFGQLEKLLKTLDHPGNDIFLHIDKTATLTPQAKTALEQACVHSPLYFVERQSVHWGGYSQVLTEVTLLEAAVSHGTYGYYHLLSGVDLPLQTQSYIHAFFEENNGYEFLTFSGEDICERVRPADRIRYWHPFMDHPLPSPFFNKLLMKGQGALLKLQKLFRVDRLKGKNITVGYGSNWFSITHDLATYVVSQKEQIRRTYRSSLCADEVFLHTLVVNSPFNDKVYIREGVHDLPTDKQGNRRYINWWDGSPYTWREKDIPQLLEAKEQGYLFSRKFSEKTDEAVVNYLYHMIIDSQSAQ